MAWPTNACVLPRPGVTKLNQTDFGIKPVSIAGGAVKVNDQLRIEIDIYPAEFAHLDR